MVPFSCLISDSGVVTVYVNGKPHTFAQDHPHMDKVKKAIKEKDVAEIVRLSSIPRAIESYAGTTVKVENGVVHYKDKPLHNSLTRRILKLMAEGFPFTPMLKFLEKLMQNGSKHSVDELYNFLVHRNLPITENGNFLAYKAVRPDYLDWHSGTVRNQIGDTPKRLERNEVDDDWRIQCSNGYHVGAIEYVSDFHRGEGHVMIVEVDPVDVIAVPTDSSFTKCRVCFYTVVGEMDGELLAQVYRTTHNSYEPSTPASVPAAAAPAAVGSMSNVDDSFPRYQDQDDDDEDEEDVTTNMKTKTTRMMRIMVPSNRK
jgi:hypothetical protein